MINLDKLDPNWQVAARHGQASRVGINPLKKGSNVGTQAVCQCCFNIVYKDPAPLCASTKQLQFLGFGFPLYYVFLRNCIILLLISICSYNGLSLYWAFHNNHSWCHPSTEDTTHHRLLASTAPSCVTFMVEMSRVESTVAMQQQILRIFSFVVHLCFLIYMRDKLVKLQAYYDERTTSLSDYAVIIKNMPSQAGLKEKFQNFFKKQFKSSHQIKKVALLPEYEEIKQLRQQKMKIVDQLRPFYEKENFQQQQFGQLNKELQKIEKKIFNEAVRMKDQADKDQLVCQKAIVIFNTDQEKSEAIEEFVDMDISKRGPYFGVGCEKMVLKEAPEPRQILWENINVKQENKKYYYLLGWFLSLLVLVIVTIIFYFIMQKKALNLIDALHHLDEHPGDATYQRELDGAIAVVYIMLFLIVLFNKLGMVVLFHIFTDLERQDTSSKYQFSFGLKYCLGLFFTTALMTLAVEAVRFNNYYSHLYGVIEEETVMFFLNAIFVPLFWLLNPLYLFKLIKRSIKHGKRSLTQKQAHELMQESEYDIGKRYAEIIETMWFTFLYASIIPIGAMISFFGLIFYYWIDKWNLLRRSTLSIEVQGKLVKTTMKLLDFTLIMKPVGEIMFDQQIRSVYTVGSIVMIIVAFIYIISPIDSIIEWINPEDFHLQEKTFDEVKAKFKDSYLTLHPIYKIANPMKVSQKLKRAGVSFKSEENADYYVETEQKHLDTEPKNFEIELKLDNTISDML